MEEITTIQIYKKDIPRINILKYLSSKRSNPELIKSLLDEKSIAPAPQNRSKT